MEETKLVVADRIADLAPEAWDRLTEQTPFASRRWLAFCERVADRAQPYYLVAAQGDSYLAAAIFWLYSRPQIPDFPSAVGKLLAPIFRRRPLMVCEIPIAAASGLVLPEDRAAAQEALDFLFVDLDRLARQKNASFVVFGHLKQDTATGQVWPAGYELVRLFPGTQLDLAGTPDYAAYLAGLNKKNRKNIRRNLEAARENGLTVTRSRIPDPAQAFNLAAQVAARHGDHLIDEIRRVFELASEVEACWLVAEKDGRTVGFDLLFGDKGVWKVFITGNDYSEEYVYFLLSDEDIRFSIDRSAKMLYAGTHLYDFKERIGYERRDDGYVRFCGFSPVSRLLSQLVRFRQKPLEKPTRKPL